MTNDEKLPLTTPEAAMALHSAVLHLISVAFYVLRLRKTARGFARRATEVDERRYAYRRWIESGGEGEPPE